MKRPSWIPWAFVICAAALCTGLGVWQVKRLEWKENLLYAQAIAQEAPPLTEWDGAESAAWRRAVLSGTPGGTVLHFIGRQSGGHIRVFPLTLKGGVVVLVAHDWVASDTSAAPLPKTLTVEGTLRSPRGKRLFSPENQPERNIWFTEDLAAMSAATGKTLAPLVLETGPLPVLRNDHLGYALTWFMLAVVALVMGWFYQKPRRDSGR